MSDDHILICCPMAEWQGLIPSIERNCADCGQAIAIDAKNEPLLDKLVTVCVPCGVKRMKLEPPDEIESLVGGTRYSNFGEALVASLRSIKRRQG